MSQVFVPPPRVRSRSDAYGFARMPRGAQAVDAQHVDRVAYGRFRNVYLYITEACQLRCGHCYMGDRLDHARKMPLGQIVDTLTAWRQMGGSKVTLLGGEPTLHPQYCEAVRAAGAIGYEHVITTTNGLRPAARRLAQLEPSDFAYVQVSLDGGAAESHDRIRGEGTFDTARATIRQICARGFDTRIICTVNRVNQGDALRLLDFADETGVSLVKFHVFSTIGAGGGNDDWAISPTDWIEFYKHLEQVAGNYDTRVWYQPTYALVDDVARFEDEGFQGCIGRTLDRISIFPDGRCYVCSYLFDTSLHFAEMHDGAIRLNHGENEFDLFAGVLAAEACGSCKATGCRGGCPAEQLVMGTSSCTAVEQVVPVCRLWKSDAKRPQD